MIEVVLASRNKKKIAEMQTLLGETCGDAIRVLSLDDIGFDGDITEDGSTFAENAIIKAATPASMGYIGIADDSGLCVDALDGAPGIYSARYSEDMPDTGADRDTMNNEKLLRELDGVPDEQRGAKFVCTVACVIPERYGVPADAFADTHKLSPAELARAEKCAAFAVRGEFCGVINHAAAGCGGFGYDPLFYLPEYGMTSAEILAEEKNRISHRGRAVRAFGEVFSRIAEEYLK